MSRLAGLLLNAAGVAVLWLSGVGYTTTEKLLDLGPVHATHEVDHRLDVPPIVGVVLVAIGTVLLLAASFSKKRSG
jgi:hypothetical protein